MIKLISVMGCGWGYRFYRNKNEREGPVFMFSVLNSWDVLLLFDFSGGILGWDPVHTTCIPDEMMMML